MHTLEAIRLRRSIKPEHMKPDPVDRPLIETILEAANWAPSHGRTEPWRFIVFTGDARASLASAVARAETGVEGPIEAVPRRREHGGPRPQSPEPRSPSPRSAKIHFKMTHAPVVIAIVCEPATSSSVELHEEIAAVAMAVQNMHLAARSLGLGGFWSSGKKAFRPEVATFLRLEPHARCLGFFYVGWPAIAWPEGERGAMARKVTWRGADELPIS